MGILDKTIKVIEANLDKRLNDLQKSEEVLEKKEKEGGIGRKGLIFDPFVENANNQGLFRPKTGFITNALLKQVSRRTPAAAIIIHTRSSQVQSFCRPQSNRFDTGYKFQPRDKSEKPDQEEIQKLEAFINNCGIKEERAPEDRLTFDQFGYMVTSDMLRYGHCAIERIPRKDGGLYAFLPLASEGIYYANPKADPKDINAQRNLWRERMDEEGQEEPSPGDVMFVQVLDNKVIEEFSREEMVFAKLNNETDTDLSGYSISPLERALSMLTAQLQIENHQRGFFTHGVASRGILVIQGDMTPNQLRVLQSQWTQQTTGPLNSWRTPVLAGIKGVQWVPLTAGNRDMEYAAYQDHVLRTVHGCFTIDPEETGFGYLSRGTEQRSLGESSNEYKILASQSRGLRPILSRIEAIINEEIMPGFDEKLAEKYEFCFVGLDAESRIEETQRLTGEVSLHTSINEARSQAELEPLKIGGEIILNPLLLQTLQSNMPKGMFMELYMGIEGASQRPDLQYIPDPMWFQFQQMQMQLMQQQAMGMQQPQGGEGQPQEGEQEEGQPQPQQEGEGDEQQGDQPQEGQPQQDNAMAQAQAQSQAMAMAAQMFMQSNPEIFKSLRDIQYSSKIESLMKGNVGRPSDKHVDHLYNKLMKDYELASKKMIEEVMGSIKEDLEDKCDHGDDDKE
jgi:hypothetical protein